MQQSKRSLILGVTFFLGVLSLGAVLSSEGMGSLPLATFDKTQVCGGMEFGRTHYGSTGAYNKDSYYTVDASSSYEGAFSVSIDAANSSKYYGDESSAIKLGIGDTAGKIKFDLSSPRLIDHCVLTASAWYNAKNTNLTTGFKVTLLDGEGSPIGEWAHEAIDSVADLSSCPTYDSGESFTGITTKAASFVIETVKGNDYRLSVAHISFRFEADPKESPTYSSEESYSCSGLDVDPISFHFLELGNAQTGDSTFIKAGDKDILIDAGSNYGSSAAIKAAIDNYCTDGKLELVIATHAHMDHISGFTHNNAKVSDGEGTAGIFYQYKIGQIIDFAGYASSSRVVDYYLTARDFAVRSGATHYTAKECFDANSTGELGAAHRVYSLGKGLSMEILHTQYYDKKSDDENDNSVCVMFHQGKKNFLFTGDLETSGEKSLLQDQSLPKVELYKGGHHGSYTAAYKDLFDTIQPKKVAICCCAGNQQYTTGADHAFPTQEFIDGVAPYTKEIYCTTLGSFTSKADYSSFNGQINIDYDGDVATVNCSKTNVVLPESEWFNRYGDMWQSSRKRSFTVNNFPTSGYKVGDVSYLIRDPEISSSYASGTRCLTKYKVTYTVTAVTKKYDDKGQLSGYDVAFSCSYDYVDSFGVSHSNEASMPNRLWPTSGVGLA